MSLRPRKAGCERFPAHNRVADSIKIKTMCFTAIAQPILLITIVFFLGLLPYTIAANAVSLMIAFLLTIAFASVGIAIIWKYYKERAISTWCIQNCEQQEPDTILGFFQAKEIANGCYIAQMSWKNAEYHVDIYDLDHLDKKGVVAKKRLRKCTQKDEQLLPFYKVAKQSRIQLMLCQTAEEEYLHRIGAEAKHAVNRTECLFQVVYLKDDHLLFLPYIFDNLDYSQIKRYYGFWVAICDAFCLNLNPTGELNK